MQSIVQKIFFTLYLFSLMALQANAAVNLMEDQTTLANGNGVSTPSFWQGLSGQNPAGMAFNNSVKIQASTAKFKETPGIHKESVGLFAGNGLIGLGGEWTKHTTAPITGNGSLANWGVAGRLAPIKMIFGFAGHYTIPNGIGTYDGGVLVDFGYRIRVGAMLPDFARGAKFLGVGFNYLLTQNFDFVLDGAYGLRNGLSVLKPGLSAHFGFIQASIAHGVKLAGVGDLFVTQKTTAALSLRFTRFLFAHYEYQGLTLHRLGLTLRWN